MATVRQTTELPHHRPEHRRRSARSQRYGSRCLRQIEVVEPGQNLVYQVAGSEIRLQLVVERVVARIS